MAKDTVEHNFQIETQFNMYVHYPDTVLKGLIKIGSLMALLRISLLLHYLHKRNYEREIS